MSTQTTNSLIPDISFFLNDDYLRVIGDVDNNVLFGSFERDFLKGEAGDDTLRGRAGADLLAGDDGDDEMFGGADNDVLYGGIGNDNLRGGKGEDILFGGFGSDVMRGGKGGDILFGGLGSDVMRGNADDDFLYGDIKLTADDFDDQGRLLIETTGLHGNDQLRGGSGNDTLIDQLGSDRLIGGAGNDILLSVSDSNAPVETVEIGGTVADLKFKSEFYNPNDLDANDRLTGGAGSDTFKFDLLMNAKEEIYTKHIQEDGLINWGMGAVAGENGAYHDHWVEGIGFDVITDFSGTGGEGDQIVITGHTVTYKILKELENRIVLGVYSDQGADGVRGGGAHDLDVLGVIRVNHDGNFNLANDVSVVHQDLGAF